MGNLSPREAPEEVRRDVDAVDADAAVAPERTGDGGAPGETRPQEKLGDLFGNL